MRSPRRIDRGPGVLPAGFLAAMACLLIASGTQPLARASGTGEAARREERALPKSDAFDAPAPRWREGPVRYLLTQEEDMAYRRLASDEERTRFIARFWASRDPDPSTPENEYRSLFLKRVEDASRLFRTESTKPGWKTDRGKIYILLGPPDDLTQPPVRPRSPEIITWTYREPPPGTGASPNSQVSFVRDPSGEYRMTTRVGTFLSETTMSRALALQALQMSSLPGARAVPGGAEGAEPVGAPAPLRMQTGYFRAGDGRTLVVVTVWAQEILFAREHDEGRDDRTPASAPFKEAVARLVPVGEGDGSLEGSGGSTVLRAEEGPLARAPDQSRVFQGGCVVRPGDYSVEVSLLGADSSALYSLSQILSVPAFDGGALAIGHVTFASHLERLESNPWPEYTAPFVLGRLRVMPRDDNLFRQGEDLAFYFQVLGGSTDPIEGLPDLDLEYRFLAAGEAAAGSTALHPFGHPIHLTHEQNLVQGFALSLAGWPPGPYRLEVIVTDNLTGGTARSEVPFRVR